MNTTSKYLLSICVLGGGTGCSLFTYNQLTKKGEGDGFRNSLEKYKENSKEDLKTIGIQENTSEEEAVEKIKSFCESKINTNLEYRNFLIFSKFCGTKFHKVKDLLATNGIKNFASTDEDYEISLFLLKDKKGRNIESLKKISNIEDLKNGCNRTLNSSTSNTNQTEIIKADFFCKAHTMRTIEDYIKIGLDEKNINIAENYMFESNGSAFKQPGEISEKLKDSNLSIPDFSQETENLGKKAKEGCLVEMKKKLESKFTASYIEVVSKICQGRGKVEALDVFNK